MFVKTEELKGFVAVIKKTERFNDEYVIQQSLVKLVREPSQIYVRQLAPKEGVEVLVNSTLSHKAVVNLNSFPWVNLYLDPNGSLMRKKQHHKVADSGFDLMVSILAYELASNNPNQELIKKPDIRWGGKQMFHLELSNGDYKIVDYKVKEGENLDTIADRLKVNAYYIMEINSSIDSYTDIRAGQVIKVPNHYAKSMTLYIDKDTRLPLMIKVFDQKGLYEKYEYNSITVNPSFAENEFTEEFEHYNF